MSDSKPPWEAYFVVEVDLKHDRDEPLYVHLRGPFATREDAEHERDEQQTAWRRALDDWEDGNPYDFKGWQIVETKIWDHQLRKLERQDEESHRIAMDAVRAVGTALIDEEVTRDD
ncbi:hypothetical protein PM085_15710 [Halorubrum ezzemoulense]|uniref:Uncharacterized protein n=1 Tax=Halorubrum ezzemoulense TaxID=337243 RepID=A0ABT4Z7K3_HALEZ|nr:hypothetical protein [Halorubrum ezzemoulense]MDB2293703.1 hypothetical protein [Halorubrum ezzemoulense]